MSVEWRPRVAVVGPCASGKTSTVKMLREHGLNAYSVAQEHSAVATLWAHLEPDIVVYLSVDLETIRQRRRDPHWPKWLYETQLERLEDARARADAVVETDSLTPPEVVKQIVDTLGHRKDEE